ncbi:HD domain-containing protein, partial [Sphingomonas sp.]|uniref:HD domain-containing protein n=1 Tax=Sphingomonas sp. TaxID=28214 RepID=UPI002EDA016B
IHSADRIGSIAERLFIGGWAALVAGMPVGEVMERIVAAALAAARLGDLDAAKLRLLGLAAGGTTVLEAGFDAVTSDLDAGLRSRLRATLAAGAPPTGATPAFVGKLAWQPRAGVTCPGRARVVLQPSENHAEHCLMVAVYAVIASPWYDADPTKAFLAAMAHHLHNAEMPDSGYTGEMLLGAALDGVFVRARDKALADLPARLAEQVRGALAPIAGDATPEAKSFHVADVLDRVLEIDQHLRTRQLTMAAVLDEYGLVHDGPVKPFHDRILADAGLA